MQKADAVLQKKKDDRGINIMNDEIIIEVNEVFKKYDDATVLDNVSLEIEKGKIYGTCRQKRFRKDRTYEMYMWSDKADKRGGKSCRENGGKRC